MKRYLIRWKINENCTYAKIFDADTKADAIDDAKRSFARMAPARKNLLLKDRLEVKELIEENGKGNGDNNGIEDEED